MPTVIAIIMVLAGGAVAGSFANAIIYRLPRDISIVWPPSSCPNCRHRLSAGELVPLWSYLWQRGRCKHCGQPIPTRYFWVEMLMVLLWLAAWWRFGLGWPLLAALFFITLAVMAFFIDLEHQILPDSLNYLLITAGLLYQFWLGAFWAAVACAIGAAAFFYLTRIAAGWIWKKEALGLGDVKLAAAFGAYLAWPQVVVALFLGFCLGAAVGAALLLTGRKGRLDYIPFGPFLLSGALLTLFYGQPIFSLYWGFYVR